MKTKIQLKRNKYLLSLLVVWAIGVITLCVCYYVIHEPTRQMLTKVRQQHRESEDLLLIANKASQADVQAQLQQRVEQTAETVRHFSVPVEKTTGLVFEIGKIANELGLSEFSCKNLPLRDYPTLPEDKNVTEAWLTIQFQSGFPAFAAFVNRLERQSPTVFIEEMTLQRNDNGQQDTTVRMEVSFLMTLDQSKPVARADSSVDRDVRETQIVND